MSTVLWFRQTCGARGLITGAGGAYTVTMPDAVSLHEFTSVAVTIYLVLPTTVGETVIAAVAPLLLQR